MFHLKIIFIHNYINIILTHLTRSKRYQIFFNFMNRVYKFALIIIDDEILHTKYN